ncbi:MAG TPA: hypothetical protein VIC60_06565 [Thermomicrobiales bacterium]|jgi:hypothetical protein
MFENLVEFVGYAMHDDRLRTDADARVAKAAGGPERQMSPSRSYRDAVAGALLGMALRIAPRTTFKLRHSRTDHVTAGTGG